MKKTVLLLFIVLIVNIYPQVREIESRTYFKQGDFGFNIATNIGVGFLKSTVSTSTQNISPYDSSYYNYTNTYDQRPFNLLFTASISYCIIDGLEFEPELDINIITDYDVSLTLLGNISYTFNVPRKKVFPYVKIGYGISNFSTYFSDYYYNESSENSLSTKVFNAGAGIRFLYSSGMAMRLEINYKNYNSSHTDSYSSEYQISTYKTEINMNSISISLGFSILI